MNSMLALILIICAHDMFSPFFHRVVSSRSLRFRQLVQCPLYIVLYARTTIFPLFFCRTTVSRSSFGALDEPIKIIQCKLQYVHTSSFSLPFCPAISLSSSSPCRPIYCAYERLGEPKRALRCLRRAAQVGRRSSGSEHLEVTHLNACAVLSELGR